MGAAGEAVDGQPQIPPGRPEEFGEEVEVEEMARPVQVRAPTDPTPAEVEEHESTGHGAATVWQEEVLDSNTGRGRKKPAVKTVCQP